MTVFLIRHAHAGDRSRWDRDDRLRPLSPKGERQAAHIEARLATEPVVRVLSSPYVRCLQTVQPLARHLGLDLEAHDALAEGADVDDALALLAGLVPALEGGAAALCSHGDVIPELLEVLSAAGIPMVGRGCEKGSIWRLEIEAGELVRGVHETR